MSAVIRIALVIGGAIAVVWMLATALAWLGSGKGDNDPDDPDE